MYSPRRIEVGNTHALNATVKTDQSRRLQVTNQRMILDTSDRMFTFRGHRIRLQRPATTTNSSAVIGRCIGCFVRIATTGRTGGLCCSCSIVRFAVVRGSHLQLLRKSGNETVCSIGAVRLGLRCFFRLGV